MIDTFSDEDAKLYLQHLGIYVDDIQSLIKNQNAFAKRIPNTYLQLNKYLVYRAQTFELCKSDFTNSYDLSFLLEESEYKIKAESSTYSYYLKDHFISSKVLAAINGSFSFISDDPDYQPIEPCFDLCIRNGTVACLPSITKPTLLIVNDQPMLRDIIAHGTFAIRGRVFSWVGSKEQQFSDFENMVKVYNASNCIIRYIDAENTGFKRIVEKATNRTPIDPKVLDLQVTRNASGELFISGIQKGGGTDLFQANLIFQIQGQDALEFHVGEKVEILTIDTLQVSSISSALSIGPSIYDAAYRPNWVAQQFDLSLGVFPFGKVKYPRAILYKTADQHIHFRIFDGAPMTDHFKGVTPQEIVDVFAFENLQLEWAYHLDGGQSSKIIFRQENKLELKGSLHYMVWPTKNNTRFVWNGLNGRKLASSIVLHKGII